MEARNLSQHGLAKELEKRMSQYAPDGKRKRVYASVVNRWVNDESLPGGEYMVHLPAVLERNGHWLLTGEGPERILDQLAEGSEYEAGVRDAVAAVRQTLDQIVRRLAPRAPAGGATRRHVRLVEERKTGG